MKRKYILILFNLLWSALLLGQNGTMVTDTILVRGNCVMCKNNIEQAIQQEPSAEGNWNIQTKVLKVKYDPNQTTFNRIMQRVADAGYDSEMYIADDEAYNSLDECCLYDREMSWENIRHSAGTHLPDKESDAHENEHNPNHEDSVIENSQEESLATDETEDNWEDELLDGDSVELKSIQLTGNKAATAIDGKGAGLTFKIDEKELLKAACCNLSESFETNATVDVNYANAVTGTKQIKMLGLDQKYTLISKELLPEIRGLAAPYGMNFIPGRWIAAIQLTKGGSTVTNGYESIAGQINTELHKTHRKGKTSLNIFGNLQSRLEGNIVHTDTINAKWAHSVLAHGNATLDRQDNNDDNFMDQPIGRQINATYLLNYNDLDYSGWGTHFGVHVLDDHRLAGQMDFVEDYDRGNQEHYGVGIDITRFQAWNKTGYVFKNKPYQSFGIMNQFTYHEQNSYFGLTDYNGRETTYYGNLIFESILGNTNHKYKTGASFLLDKYDEQFNHTTYKRDETVPGVFFEYTYIGNKLTAVLGSRVDFHNLAGTQFTPRVNVKYDLFPKTTLRASVGKGFRTANIFAEAQAYLASNREVVIHPSDGDIYGLDAEIAWNYGVSLQQDFRIFGRKSTVLADFFRTDFQNQVIPDLDQSPHTIVFYNMEDDSYANAFQVQWDFEPINRLEARIAYKNYQTQGNYLSGKKALPFTPEHRGFLNLAYATYQKQNGSQWSFDATLQYVGEQRIPDTSSNPADLQLANNAEAYFLLNGQVSYQLNRTIRLYAGVENLLSYQQDNPILDVENPFGNYFDGGMVWAPIMPANAYFGIDIEF